MTFPLSDQKPRLATYLCFAAAGFGVACWAPLVPFAKLRLGIGEGSLGFILLCLGLGSIFAMPLAGALSTKFGSKPVILAGGYGMAIFLPFLASVGHAVSLAVVLLFFGAFLGSVDVAMNLQAVEVERRAARPMMSGFHALFSLGAFAGSGFMTLLLSNHISPFEGTLGGAIVVAGAVTAAAPGLLKVQAEGHAPLFALPHGVVLILALLALVGFLVEGALLDWGALLLVSSKLVGAIQGGIGYMLFSIAMTVGRLTGDWTVTKLGERRVFVLGGILAISGFAILLEATLPSVALSGFICIGLGLANIVPIVFRHAGRQQQMPVALAVAAVTGAGYAGMLVGPALMGFLAQAFGLRGAFVALALLLCLIPALNKSVAKY